VYAAGMLTGAALSAAAVSVSYPFERLEVFAEALSIIHSRYVEERSSEDLVYDAIGGLTQGLDDYSIFMNPDQYREMREETSGQYFGIGVSLDVRDGSLFVVRVMEGAPAQAAGLEPGDEIVAVDGKLVAELGDGVALARIKGQRGSSVLLEIRRKGLPGALEFSVVRDQVRTNSVSSARLEGNIAWLRIERFQRRTVDEVRRELGQLFADQASVRGLVVDLRNNPGGYLSQAVEVADLWLPEGVIVSTVDRRPTAQRDIARRPGTDTRTELVVLIDGQTASAAEIVAGALKDRGRALVIGSSSYGKGSVQQFFDLSDGSALKLTTARYFTPSGVSIQGAGVRPDISFDRELSELQRSALDKLLAGGSADPAWVRDDPVLQLGILALRDGDAVRGWAAQLSDGEKGAENGPLGVPADEVAGADAGR